MSEVSLFDSPAENPRDVEGYTVAALLGDGSPVRTEPEAATALAAAGASVGERCPSCGMSLPDAKHLVHAALRAGESPPGP